MRSTLSFTVILMILSIFNINAQTTDHPKKLVGIWEHKGERSSDAYDKGLRAAPPGKYKVISADGSFTNFNLMIPKSIVSIDGTWKTTSDSTLVETIVRSINPSLKGKDNMLYYAVKEDKFLYIRWFLNKNTPNKVDNIWIEELWEKVDFPKIKEEENNRNL